jgi:hypothetical protein
MEQEKSIKPFNAAKFTFLYLTHLVSLVFTAISFGVIIFQAINKFIDDPVGIYDASFQKEFLQFGIAALLVFAPVYFVVSRFIYKSLFDGEVKRDSSLRRWLTYLILFVSFLVFAGYLVGFIINFLNGELTLKFILKVITVLAIAATVFSFYFYDISRKEAEGKKDKVIKNYLIASLSAVIIVFIGSFFVADNPSFARNKRLDNNIIMKFNQIDSCVEQYYREKKEMPADLESIKNNCTYLLDKSLSDEVTKKAFEYKAKEGKKYELCAEFRTSNKNEKDQNTYYYNPEMRSTSHDKGWQCLERKIMYEEPASTIPAEKIIVQ